MPYEKDARVRRSPSGPVLSLGFGAGAMLRLAEATTTILGSLAVPIGRITLGRQLGDDYKMELDFPHPDADYRVTAFLDVVNTDSDAEADVQLYLETSKDGVNWFEHAANTHTISLDGNRYIRCDLTLTAGADLGVTEGDVSLFARARIGSSVNTVEVSSEGTPSDANDNGTFYLGLSEHFPADSV